MDSGFPPRSSLDLLQFGPLALDCERGELRKAGQPVPLRPKTFALLAYLAKRPGRVVSKQELLEALWTGVVVTDDSLTQAISELRVALGDADHKVIRTLPRRGYLFDAECAPEPMPAGVAPPQASHAPRIRRRLAYALLAGFAVLGLLGFFAWHAYKPVRGMGTELAERRSIAAMPFTDLSDPKAPHVVQAVDDRLSADLGRLDDTKVVARESAATLGASESVDPRRAGRELGVRHLLTGSVRLEGAQLTVNVRLLQADTGALLWSERFVYPSVAQWMGQGDFLARVANELDTRVSRKMLEPAKRRPSEGSAIEHWMRGRYIMGTVSRHEQLLEAREQFAAALRAEPQSAHALTGLAFTHVVEVIQRWSRDPKQSLATAKVLAQQALEVDPDHQAALKAIAGAQMFAGELAESMSTTQRMLALNPNDAHANRDLAANFYFLGRWVDALRQLEVAERLNPLDVSHMSKVNGMAAVALIALHRYDEAIERARRNAVLLPASIAPLTLSAAAEAHRGNLPAARTAAAEVMRRDPDYHVGKGARRGSTAPAYLEGIQHLEAGLRLAGFPDARSSPIDQGGSPAFSKPSK